MLEAEAASQAALDLEQYSTPRNKTKAKRNDLAEQDEVNPTGHTLRHQPIPSPVFDGTTNVDNFIATFKAIARHNLWTAEEKLLRLQLALKGPASSGGVQGESCREIFMKLRCQYGLSTDTANALLRNLKLKPKDNIHQFGERVLTLVQKAYPGLTSEQQDHQAKQEVIYSVASIPQLSWTLRLTPPTTLADAVDVIHKYYAHSGLEVGIQKFDTEEVSELKQQLKKQAEEIKVSQQEMMQQFTTLQTSLTQQLVDSQKQLAETQRELLASVTFNRGESRGRPKKDLKCFNCQEVGHFSRSCTKPKKAGNDMGH